MENLNKQLYYLKSKLTSGKQEIKFYVNLNDVHYDEEGINMKSLLNAKRYYKFDSEKMRLFEFIVDYEEIKKDKRKSENYRAILYDEMKHNYNKKINKEEFYKKIQDICIEGWFIYFSIKVIKEYFNEQFNWSFVKVKIPTKKHFCKYDEWLDFIGPYYDDPNVTGEQIDQMYNQFWHSDVYRYI